MAKKKRNINFNGGISMGEAARIRGRKLTQQAVKDKTKYTRKNKHKGNEEV